MAEKRAERRLAAILAADVVGYSRLMGEDESGTLAQLKTLRKELLDPKVAEYNGRIIKTMGDGVLVEFPSVVDAVQHAVDVQHAMGQRNAAVPEDRRMELRIGINVGDVIVEGDDIYGDGVNLAARLEGLAEPGGTCVSGTVFDLVNDKLNLGFDDLGPQSVKNIARPVRAYHVTAGETGPATATAGAAGEQPPALPDKPSIAVLPFENMSGDAEQEYFADGITEDIITELSRISGLFVIARHSAFVYKNLPVTVTQVGRELGVRYVLEGSVRKAGNRLRITAQLIDSTTDHHLWAERYDRDLTDIFALQDEITEKIVAALKVRLTAGEQEQVAHRYTNNLEAYDFFLRGRSYQARSTEEANFQARELYQRAIELDPDFAGAFAVLSHTYWRDWRNQWGEDPQPLERALEAAKQAVALDDSLALAHIYLAWAYLFAKQFDEAVAEGKRAVFLDPSFAEGHARLGIILSFAGEAEDALGAIQKALRLDPHYPPSYLLYLGNVYYAMGRHEEAIAVLKTSLTRNPEALGCNLWLAGIQSELGHDEEAQARIADALRISPAASIKDLRERSPFKDQALLERYLAALRKAGLPE